MKSTKLKGVALLSDADVSKLSDKFQLRLSGNSLCRNTNYKFIGFAKVDASTAKNSDGTTRTINEWVGCLLVDEKGKEIVVGINTVLGTSITGRVAPYSIHTVPADVRKFNSVSEIKNNFGKVFKVKGFETLEAQVWEKDATRPKDFPIFEDSSVSISYTEGNEITKESKVK